MNQQVNGPPYYAQPQYPNSSFVPPTTPPQQQPLRWRLPLVLFVATLLTTHATGALMAEGRWYELHKGIAYGTTLMLILFAHEMGHFLACRSHNIKASLPHFIPFFPLFGIGTLGAFIRIKEPFRDRKSMLDIGIAGPLAGFFVALPATIIGLALSDVTRMSVWEGGLALGDSLLTKLLSGILTRVWRHGRPSSYTRWASPVIWGCWSPRSI